MPPDQDVGHWDQDRFERAMPADEAIALLDKRIEDARGVSEAAQQAPSSEPMEGPSSQADGACGETTEGAS